MKPKQSFDEHDMNILRELAKGYSNQEIADATTYSLRFVKDRLLKVRFPESRIRLAHYANCELFQIGLAEIIRKQK